MILILDMTPEEFAKVSAFVDERETKIHDSDRFGSVRDFEDRGAEMLTFEKPFSLFRFLRDNPRNVHWNSLDSFCLVEIMSTKLNDDVPNNTKLSVKLKFQTEISGRFRGTGFLEEADPALEPFLKVTDDTNSSDKYKWTRVTMKLPLSILAKVMELAGRFPAA